MLYTIVSDFDILRSKRLKIKNLQKPIGKCWLRTTGGCVLRVRKKIEKDNIWCNPIIATNKYGILFPVGTDKLKIIYIGLKYHNLSFLNIALNRICR